jgi:type I restriction enzyme S subunit
MSNGWPMVALGELLRLVSRPEHVLADQEYRLLGIRLDGNGPFLREIKAGTEVAADTLSRVAAGDFIYSRLFAWRGAFGVIDEGLDGCFVSGEFPTFRPGPNRIDVEFLRLWFRLPSTLSAVEADCMGSTPLTRNRFKEHFFLAMQIPLPPLDEQRRIVGRIEALAARIEEARGLGREAAKEADALLDVARARSFQRAIDAGATRLDTVATLQRGRFSYRPRNDPRFFGGRHPWIQISEIESSSKYIRHWTETLNDEGLAISRKFPKGTLLISIAATIGAVGILDFDCCVPDSVVGITPNAEQDSIFLYHYLGFVRKHLEHVAPQSAQKNINLEILAPLPVPTLRIEEQERIAAYLDDMESRVDTLRCLQAEAAAELEALLPSVLDQAFRGEL